MIDLNTQEAERNGLFRKARDVVAKLRVRELKIEDASQRVDVGSVAEILATTIAPVNPLESAIVATLGAGNYMAIVRSVDGSAGVALVEVYDLDP